jgi:hypothetical protein
LTIDTLIRKLNDDWGWASLDVSLRGDGKWTASLQSVKVFSQKGEQIERVQAQAFIAQNAVKLLVRWLRGKRVCLRGANGGADGPVFKVPRTLRIPIVRRSLDSGR